MKTIQKILNIALLLFLISSCTSDFDDINTKPDGFVAGELSAKYFLTGPQVNLYGPSRYAYWRGPLIHGDRYAGHFCFGHNQSWWSDETGYKYHGAYTDATWDWMAGALGGIDNFMKLTKIGGLYENEKMYAVGIILKALYFQKFTDIWGMVPYSEAGKEEIKLPKFDSQKGIYKGLINELNRAIEIIGDSKKTGDKIDQDLGDNDVYFKGDLQKWKKLANSLKLRIATRALGSEGASDFAPKAIKEAITSPLLSDETENCILPKDVQISQWASACYGDIWHNFGAPAGWTVSKDLVDALKNNNDPRLAFYTKPAKGGIAELIRPENNAEKHQERIDFLLKVLENAEVAYKKKEVADTTFIEIAKDTYYIGQPVRLNGDMKSYAIFDFFSIPQDKIFAKKDKNSEMTPEIIFTVADTFFLRAEAALRGYSSENAENMFHEGIKQAMLLWNVSADAANNYIANAEAAKLTGSLNEKIGKIALQRWLVNYTNGFEAWAIVRNYAYTGFTTLSDGVSNSDFYGMGNIDGKYPTRMRYGSSAINTNENNVNAAIAQQGPDEQSTPLWWTKK